METLKERLQREAMEKHPVDDFHGHHIIAAGDLNALIFHTTSETLKEAAGVIEELRKKVLPTHAEENGYGCALDDAITAIEGLAAASNKQ